jgi:hypothetical protein
MKFGVTSGVPIIDMLVLLQLISKSGAIHVPRVVVGMGMDVVWVLVLGIGTN